MKIRKIAQRLSMVLLTAILFTGFIIPEKIYAENEYSTVKLTANISLSEDIVIAADKKVILDLNNHVIDMNQYKIINNGTLIITDSATTPTAIKWDSDGNIITDGSDGYETYGGVLMDGDDQTITNNGELKFEKGNIVACGAPAVYNAASKTFTMTGGHILFSRNKTNQLVDYAGGVDNYGTFIMSGGVIGENIGDKAGGVYNTDNCVFTMTGGAIESNLSPQHEAGGVYNSGTFTMSAGSIEDNSAPLSSGGGVYNDSNFTFSGGTIGYNKACESGGGVYNCFGATFKMTGGTICYNSLTYGNPGGSGVRNQGTMTMTAGNIEYNTSKSMAGGVMNDGKFTMEGGSISNNTSENDGAGVINSSEFIMKGGSISSNCAITQYAWGGGISNSGTVKMSGGEIKDNSAINGGGVCINNGSFTLTEGKISENRASVGGGVYVFSGSFIMSDGEITSNVAEADNAAIFADGSIYLLGGKITDNRKIGNSVSDCGAIYVSPTGSLELGGDIVIKDNLNYDEDPCNLYFSSSNGAFIINSQYPLKNGAEIYITADTYPVDSPFVTNAKSKTDAQYFACDNEKYGAAATESGGVYSFYLKHYYSICYTYYYETTAQHYYDEEKYLPGEEVQLIGEMHKDLGNEYFNGWLLDDFVHPGHTGFMTYTINENDAAGDLITLYGQYMLKISDINGKSADIDSKYSYTYKEAKDISYHIGGLRFEDLENDDPAADTEVYLDKNGNGSYEADEKLVYGTEYTATSGSIVITINKDVLNTLSIGNHNAQITINAFYNDPGNVDTFTFNSILKVTRKTEESTYRVVNTCTK